MVYKKCGRGVEGGCGTLPYWPIRVSYRYTIGIIYEVLTPIRVCAAEQGNMVFKVLSLLMMHNDAPSLKTGCLFGLEAFQRV